MVDILSSDCRPHKFRAFLLVPTIQNTHLLCFRQGLMFDSSTEFPRSVHVVVLLEVRGPCSRVGSFEEGGGNEATPGPFFPSRGRLGYTSIRSRFSPRIGVRGENARQMTTRPSLAVRFVL